MNYDWHRLFLNTRKSYVVQPHLSVLLAIASGLALPTVAFANCTINSVTGLNFGAYNASSPSASDATGQIIFVCTNVQGAITIRLSAGNAGRFAPRQMTSGRGRLEYNLYIDAARTQIWGDGTSGSSLRTLVPVNNAATTLEIFGRIPSRQFVPAGVYSDRIVVTLEY